MVDDEELKKIRFKLSKKWGRIKYFFSCLIYKLFSYFYNKKNKKKDRYINIHGRTYPNFFCDNKLRSTKYSILTFIPLFLFYQFADFLNLFYLCVSLLQVIPIFNTGYVFTFVAPLIFIILISLINEVVDDLKRFIKDLDINNEIYYTLLQNGNFKKTYSKDIQVGDIILIKSKQRVPADCILLRNLSKDEENAIKIEENKSFVTFRINKNTNVYNKKKKKNYYHFNQKFDNALIDDKYNESNNNYSEASNNLLFSENEKSPNRMKEGNNYLLKDNVEDSNKIGGKNDDNEKKKLKKKKKKKLRKNDNKLVFNNNSSNETENYTYVKTDKIDGETDWKIKYPISIFQNLKRLKDFFSIDILFILEHPKNDIYKIEASFVMFKYNQYGEFKTVENNNMGNNINDLSTSKLNSISVIPNLLNENTKYRSNSFYALKDTEIHPNDVNKQIEKYDEDDEEDDEDEEEDEEDDEEEEENVDDEKHNLLMKKEGVQNSSFRDLGNGNRNNFNDRNMINFVESEQYEGNNIGTRNGKVENQLILPGKFGENQPVCNVFPNEDNYNYYNISYRKKLNYDNFILSNSVITSSDVICMVIYTGRDTRVNMSTQISKVKRGMIDKKLNLITVFLFIILALFSMYMCSTKLSNLWYLNFVRFILLFSSVIPISLSVNLNIAKIYYTLVIQKDKEIQTTIIKNSAIIENFGNVDYIFTDKTGTLTENVMVLKVIHIGLDVIHTENEKSGLQNNMRNKVKRKFNKNVLPYNFEDINEDDVDANPIHLVPNYSINDRKEKGQSNIIRGDKLSAYNYDIENNRINKNYMQSLRQVNTKANVMNQINMNGNEYLDFDSYNETIESSHMIKNNGIRIEKNNAEDNDNMVFGQSKLGLNNNNIMTSDKRNDLMKRFNNVGNNNDTNNNGSDNHNINGNNSEQRKKKVELMVDDYLMNKTDLLDYYNDNIDDIEFLKKHKVFQTFLSFLICNNIRTLTKEHNNNDKEKGKKKKEHKEKDFQKKIYYILNVNRKKKNNNRLNQNDKMIETNTNDNFETNSSEDTETFSYSGISYQCSSPDELAFLKYATNCGFILKKKTASKIEIKYKNIALEYDILLHIPFSSETKRMSVFVRNVKNKNIYFFIKGADNILIKKCHEKYKTFIFEESDHLSSVGLRVLVHGFLNIEEQFFHNFSALYNQNKDVKGQMEKILDLVEKNIKVLAITGVEDKLQEGVGKTIEMLYNSGIKVWVLTGDKIETAICICKNANIKKKKHNIYIFRHENIKSTSQLIREFNSILNNIDSYVLFFDNIIIQNCIKYIPNAFVDFVANARAVVCCRCSPIEKKEIALMIKTIKRKKILCIGDGGNDVAMIQSADIGIGVLGKEGKQVVHDSDIIVSKFKNIKKLILYYGNNTFLQTSSLCSFLIHRGFILTYLQFIYSYIFFSIPVAIFQGWLQIGYTTYYTTTPFLSLLLDVKIKKNLIYLYPEIYKNKKHKRKLDLKSFFIIVWMSIFQGTVVMLGALKLFNDNYNNLINISFSSLILLEIMNIHLEAESWHPLMISANICSFIMYIFSMFILRNYFDIIQIMSFVFWYKVILIVLFAWLPFFIIKKVKNIITPSQFFKLA
ncbi:phospholipid-transporting ATPase, putative [Plasmodium berghei]|uniref:Phospholipid-transporting ATPase, putative n=2 Tax=Plasmodium berghei TaxID=5821 RepID=A0A509B0P7_PLABA|nr:phospholipid-transporting ATPase, putative [Plasmodium berghei ANKA]CXJ22142.1 phospholipid-transporting ATPase, putative [Plasmodium berghei]SCM26642.1 phospholipid-transporting ATPase, putative [Plasmodium berghei]SCN28562.1 phospholipid-transporting ATPase, putative [Plasmodium berghei]SCO62751.1 phospholipid-transporting ATPase, putative [Plasmodium berghei]SCO64311.1 phospholipid-transporting ATPase, putative [Plasmodium berghei]|eukprot:XP_034424207.1 phospholipid-transporting ATPase, putative [Plasmodium berghei ANKA]